MSKAKTTDPLDRKFTLETVRELSGKGIRGKYFAKVSSGISRGQALPLA